MDHNFWIPGFIKRWAAKSTISDTDKLLQDYANGLKRPLSTAEIRILTEYKAWKDRYLPAAGASIFYLSVAFLAFIVIVRLSEVFH